MVAQRLKTFIHVNMHSIRANAKNGTTDPVLTVKTYKSNDYAHEAIIRDDAGNEVARVVYRPDQPLSCGARVWIETRQPVELVVRDLSADDTLAAAGATGGGEVRELSS